jgi:hypothetical protein
LLCKAKGLEKKPSVVEEEVLVTRWEYENKMIESRCAFLRGRVIARTGYKFPLEKRKLTH